MENTLVLALLLLGGWLAHSLFKMQELKKSQPSLTLKSYLGARPFAVAYSFVAAAVAGAAFYHYGELTPITAVGTGYMADSILDKFSARTQAALK